MSKRATKDWEFIYVPENEVEEALYLGAIRVHGDARLAIPTPLPPGVSLKIFERWTTEEARYKWCFHLVQGILTEMVPPGAESARRREIPITPDMSPRFGSPEEMATSGSQMMSDLLASLGKESGEKDRVYLYPTPHEASNLRGMEGVHWDRRKRAYYATKRANLNDLFRFMTPSAQAAWQGFRTAQRTTDYLVTDMARAEVVRRQGAGGTPSGGPAATAERSLVATPQTAGFQGGDQANDVTRKKAQDQTQDKPAEIASDIQAG